MKKIIYVLVFSLIVSMIGFTGGKSVSATSLNELSNTNNDFTESFVLDGVQYFYENTNNYTLTITKVPNGEEIITYKDKVKGNNDEFFYKHTLPTNEKVNLKKTDEFSSLNVLNEQSLMEIRNDVINKEIILEKRLFQEFATADTNLTDARSTTDAYKINYSLTDRYGQQYTYKSITSKTEKGYTGYLYQHMTFGASPVLLGQKFFDALTAVGILATWAGTPLTGILGIVAWTSSAAGYHVLMQDTTLKKWNAKVYYQKEVKVGSVYPYRSFHDLNVIAYTATEGYAALESGVTAFKSSDYDNNSTIISTGITNYINMN